MNQTPETETAAPTRLRVAVSDNRLRTVYANAFQTRWTGTEFLLTCGLSVPEKETGTEEDILALELDTRLVMSPGSAKNLALALTRAVQAFEAQKGEFGADYL